MPQGNAPIQLIGTLTADPEIRDVGSAQVASFSVAMNPRKKQGDEWVDGDPTFWRCSAWRELATNVAASLHKGDQVIVIGTVGERKYQTREGEERSSMEVEVEAIGPSLRFATAQVTRAGGRGGQRPPAGNGDMAGRSGPQGQPRQQRPQPAQQAPQQTGWSGGGYDDETPF